VLQSVRPVLRGRPWGTRSVATCSLTSLSARVELHDLRALHRLRPGSDPHEMEMHLASSLNRRGARRPRSQRAPAAKSEISCGVAVSKPTTSSIPGSAGSAIEKLFETMPTTTSRAGMPDACR
jgi:hypothetical protein